MSSANFQLELALDVEVAMPFFMQRLMQCVVKFEKVYPKQKPNMLTNYIRTIIEGKLSKDVISDEVMGNDVVSICRFYDVFDSV